MLVFVVRGACYLPPALISSPIARRALAEVRQGPAVTESQPDETPLLETPLLETQPPREPSQSQWTRSSGYRRGQLQRAQGDNSDHAGDAGLACLPTLSVLGTLPTGRDLSPALSPYVES